MRTGITLEEESEETNLVTLAIDACWKGGPQYDFCPVPGTTISGSTASLKQYEWSAKSTHPLESQNHKTKNML
jgi:hypothetical protein